MLTKLIKTTLPLTLLASTLLISPLAKADNPIKNIGQLPSSKTLIAQEDNACGEMSLFVTAETRKFYLYICGGDYPNTYVGIAKNGTGGIRLPLRSYSRNTFVAVNKNTRYTLTRSYLTVTQSGKVILKERIINWN